MSQSAKRGPGRPRKKPMKAPDVLKGIIVTPTKEKRMMELVYQNPLNFKKLFSMIYSINRRKVYFLFRKKEIVIVCKDHYKKLTINATILGSNMISYFCDHELKITMDNESVNELCNIIKKDFGKISLYINDNLDNLKLTVLLFEDNHESDDKKEIPISFTSIDQDLLDVNDLTYDLSFRLESNHYKKRLTTYSKGYKFCNLVYNSQIEFQYEDENFKKGTQTKYRNNKKIDLKRHVKDLYNIECKYKLETIINIFKTIISHDFYILLSQKNGICINFYIDPLPLSRINAEDYTYTDNIFPDEEKNTIIVRIFVSKDM